jgi:hypothetical protein
MRSRARHGRERKPGPARRPEWPAPPIRPANAGASPAGARADHPAGWGRVEEQSAAQRRYARKPLVWRQD